MFRFSALLVLFSFHLMAQDINKFDEKGLKHGPWQGVFEESKRVRYEGQFEHGKEVGLFKYYDDTKAHPVIATREFSDGGKTVYTTFYDQKNNKVSEGKVVNKQFEGQWTYYHYQSPAIMTTEFYKNGKLEGERKVFYKSGKIAEETNYKNGIRNGVYRKYTETGVILEEANYVNGLYEGPAVYRDGLGQIVSKGNYKAGGKHGYWEFFEDGKLVKKEKYPIWKPKSTKKKAETPSEVPAQAAGAEKP